MGVGIWKEKPLRSWESLPVDLTVSILYACLLRQDLLRIILLLCPPLSQPSVDVRNETKITVIIIPGKRP